MSEDPAILLYTSDFLTGTIDLTESQVGKYIRLLCIQHQKENNEIPKEYFNEKVGCDNILRSKFIETDTGFYNKRMRKETDKRKAFSDSRRKNISKRYEKSTLVPTLVPTSVVLVDNENEDEDINKNENKIPPILEYVKKYCEDRNNGIDPQHFLDYYESNGWRVGRSKMKSWKAAIRTWEKNNARTQINSRMPRNSNAKCAEGATAKPGEFDEGVLTLEGVRTS